MNRMNELWLGITYPHFLDNKLSRWFWKRIMCPRGIHLLDECQSIEIHCLFCDACDLEIPIEKEALKGGGK